MTEPMPKPLFDARMDQLGLKLTEVEREGIRAASRHILAAAERVRTKREVSVEPATIFAPKGTQQ